MNSNENSGILAPRQGNINQKSCNDENRSSSASGASSANMSSSAAAHLTRKRQRDQIQRHALSVSAAWTQQQNVITITSKQNNQKISPKDNLPLTSGIVKLANSAPQPKRSSPSASVKTVAKDLRPFLNTSDIGSSEIEDSPRSEDSGNSFKVHFPDLSADSSFLFDGMLAKESRWIHSVALTRRHPELQPRMRTILIEWLAQVSEVYSLQRETYYLAVEYLDRYLSQEENAIRKSQLQLVGVACLFIAAKVEEIYPPMIEKFAYITDGACESDEILEMELVIVKQLNWELYPLTINSLLEFYLQLHSNLDVEPQENDENELVSSDSPSPCKESTPKGQKRARIANSFFSPIRHRMLKYRTGESGRVVREVSTTKPHHSQRLFRKITQVVDMAIQDINVRQFKNSVLAAAAMFHFTSERDVLLVTGLDPAELRPCITFLNAYAQTVRDSGSELDLSVSSSLVDSAVSVD